jgi:hypothetical protein
VSLGWEPSLNQRLRNQAQPISRADRRVVYWYGIALTWTVDVCIRFTDLGLYVCLTMYELKLSLAPSFITKTESQVSDRTEQNRTEQNRIYLLLTRFRNTGACYHFSRACTPEQHNNLFRTHKYRPDINQLKDFRAINIVKLDLKSANI